MPKKRNILFSKILFFILIIIFAFLLKSVFEKWQDFKKAKEILKEVEKKAGVLQEKKEEAQKELEFISNPEGLKRYLKEKLDLAEKGEKVIYLIYQKENQKEQKNQSFFEKIFEKIKNFFEKYAWQKGKK